MTVFLAGDHHAEPALARVRAYLDSKGFTYTEYGYRGGENPDAKLAEFIPQLTRSVSENSGSFGILICGTGAGVEIGANRFKGIRASLCMTPQNAEWARMYDDANVLCIASWATADINLEGILGAVNIMSSIGER